MFLDKLNQKELHKVEAVGSALWYPAGAAILEEGDSGTCFGVILVGRVEVRKRLAVGQYKVMLELGPCDLVGELGYLGAATRSASVVALTECQVLEFNRTRFESFIEANPAIGVKIYHGMAAVLAERLALSDETLLDTIFWALNRPLNQPPTTQVNIANRSGFVLRKS